MAQILKRKFGFNMKTNDTNTYWQDVFQRIERPARLKCRKHRLRNCDYAVTLPPKIRDRVHKIVPYEYDKFDLRVFMPPEKPKVRYKYEFDDDEPEFREEDRFKLPEPEPDFNESTYSEIEYKEQEYPPFKLKIEPRIAPPDPVPRPDNWCSKFVCKKRKKRAIWKTRLYSVQPKKRQKTADEQAQTLMETAAERFVRWVNKLGDDRETDYSKERLIALFSVESDRTLLSSLECDPRHVKAVAKAVADKWNLDKKTEMSIEQLYDIEITRRSKYKPKEFPTVIFGRTVPHYQRPWIPTKIETRIKTVFPRELVTAERTFRGIKHLRVTKVLMDFYKRHPKLEKPIFLARDKLFRGSGSDDNMEPPLYEQLKLKF